MSLRELFVDDDLGISQNPETYQDQKDPPPPLPGNYKMVVVGAIVPRKDSAGKLMLTDGQFKTLTIQRAKIVEPVECGKEFGLFADLRTKPFKRVTTDCSDLADFTRSMDQTRGWDGLLEGIDVLEELVGQSTPFTVQLGWEAYDTEFVAQEFDRLGVTKFNAKMRLDKGVLDAIYKKARLGTKAFKPDGLGGLLTTTQGPSGATLNAKPRVKKWIPSLTEVPLGPFRVKAA